MKIDNVICPKCGMNQIQIAESPVGHWSCKECKYNDRAFDKKWMPYFKKGDKVYRAKWDKIEEGEVVFIQLASISNYGSIEYDVNGKYTSYSAKFGKDNWSEYERQLTPWKFFKDKKQAYKRLAQEIEDRIAEYQKKIKKWETSLYIAKECSK